MDTWFHLCYSTIIILGFQWRNGTWMRCTRFLDKGEIWERKRSQKITKMWNGGPQVYISVHYVLKDHTSSPRARSTSRASRYEISQLRPPVMFVPIANCCITCDPRPSMTVSAGFSRARSSWSSVLPVPMRCDCQWGFGKAKISENQYSNIASGRLGTPLSLND